jgi:magnesium-transporting ATPase (P-type)
MQSRNSVSHHHLPAHEVVLLLETDMAKGLTSDEAAQRIDRFGPNVLPKIRSHGPLLRLLFQFHHPLIYVLFGATIITAVLGEWVDAGVIFGVVLVNAIIGFVQESRAEAALDALVSLMKTEATVRRDGKIIRIPSAHLVPGDLVLLESGDKTPADLRLVSLRELRVDESALTGESLPVDKADQVVPPETIVADRKNMAFSGTLVTYGQGTGVVVATELGRIHQINRPHHRNRHTVDEKTERLQQNPYDRHSCIGRTHVRARMVARTACHGNIYGGGRPRSRRDP